MKPSAVRSVPPEYFDAKYAEKLDYWNFETSAYEAAKYADTVQSMPKGQYQNAFEIGCSIGVLTARLAKRCSQLLAIDFADQALTAAKVRCAALSNVRIAKMRFPDDPLPSSTRFDLIVISEVGYYWSRDDLLAAQGVIEERLESEGHLILVHWTPPVLDYPLTGDEVHESFLERPSLEWLQGHRADRYRLDVLEKKFSKKR